MKKQLTILLLILSTTLLIGCAELNTQQEDSPVVSLTSFKMLPHEGITPRFEIGLNIVNPSRQALSLKGIYYTVDIEGHRVLAGVTNSLPVVESYSEANIVLEAGVDLLSGINLFRSLFNQPKDTFHYSFNAKLDPGGFTPNIYIQEKGEISFSP